MQTNGNAGRDIHDLKALSIRNDELEAEIKTLKTTLVMLKLDSELKGEILIEKLYAIKEVIDKWREDENNQ